MQDVGGSGERDFIDFLWQNVSFYSLNGTNRFIQKHRGILLVSVAEE